MGLSSLESVDRTALRWLRTAESPMAFELASGDTRVARLRWARHGGSLATAESSSVAWTLKRGGFLNPEVTVRVAGAEANIARLSAHLSSHRIQFAGGRSYSLHRAGLLVPAWTVAGDAGTEVLHIEPVRVGRRLEGGAVLVSTNGAANPDLLLLILVSWYFIVLAWFEDEALVPLEGT